MVTIASEKILAKLADETTAIHIALSGNVCVDKKPAAINIVEGRGKSVIADILIPKDIVAKKLKTTDVVQYPLVRSDGAKCIRGYNGRMISEDKLLQKSSLR